MGFLNRFFKKVEDVNNGKSDMSELEAELYIESPEELAMDFWVQTAQNIIVNVVKATNNSVDRAFVLIDMGEYPSFDIFYQIGGTLVMWNQLEDTTMKDKIINQLLPQASSVASAVNSNFAQVEHPKIAFAELQFEWKTRAWFSHVIWEEDEKANQAKEDILSKWFDLLNDEIKVTPLDSDSKLSWYP